MFRPDRLTVEWWLVLVVTLALVAGSVAGRLVERFDAVLFDVAMRAQPRDPNPGILLVTIDDRSLAELGPWPWPRARLAQLQARLAEGHPRAVALDLLLPEPRDPAGDAALAAALASGAPTYLPVQFAVPGRDGAAFDVVEPLAPFRTAAAGLGHANLVPDADGVVRRVYRNWQGDGRRWPHLAARLANPALAIEPVRTLPADAGALIAQDPAMIAYIGPQGSFPTISAVHAIRGELPVSAIAGKRVLVGMTAAGIGDAYATPVGGDRTLMTGLEIQANLLDSLLSDRLIVPVEGAPLYLFSLLPIVAVMVGLRRLRPRRTLALLAALVCALLAGTAALLWSGWWIGPGSALLGLIAVFPLWNWRRLAAVSGYMADELEKLDAEHDPLERPRPDLSRADFVDRQMGLLRSAIDRERDLRRFLVDRIAQLPDAVLVTDPAGKVVIANDAARALWRSLGGVDAPAAVAPLLARLALDAAPPAAADTVWQTDATSADGRHFALRAEPQRGADEALIGAVLRIAETTAMVQARREREDVLQLLSHDMRAPQVSILTLLDSAPEQPLAARIRSYAERTLRMADGFVQLARAQSLPFVPQDIDIADVAREAIDALWPQASARGVTVRGNLPEEPLYVAGDRSLLTRALVNLIDNAVRYSADGQSVEVAVAQAERHCRITVADHGPGMPPELRERLFQRFQSDGGKSGRPGGGVGLGLAFVQTTVTRHGGTVTCDSTEGSGTRFVIELPLAPDQDDG